MQAIALKHINSLAEGRQIVAHSFDVETFEPGNPAGGTRCIHASSG